MEAYFDNAATTKVYPEARDIMIKLMDEDYGNPSSLHMKGVTAEKYIKEAADIVAGSMKAEPSEIFFTSGGTESNNLAIIGTAMAHKRQGMHIISTVIEHASVISTLEFLKASGFEITYISVDSHGIIDLEELSQAVREDTILVSCMYVNNEIGAVEPLEDVVRIVRGKNPNTIIHSDCVQAYGKIPVYPKKTGLDLMSVSGHKLHGPKGSGALFIKNKTLIRPIIYGGGQQKNLRSGTENVPAIAGMGAAVKRTFEGFSEKTESIRSLKDYFIEKMTSLPEVYDNSGDAPHIASISFTGVRSEVMLHALEEKGIYVSSGSACSSNKKSVSGVLSAIALPKERLESTLRFSFGEDNTKEQADYAYEVISKLLPILRRYVRK